MWISALKKQRPTDQKGCSTLTTAIVVPNDADVSCGRPQHPSPAKPRGGIRRPGPDAQKTCFESSKAPACPVLQVLFHSCGYVPDISMMRAGVRCLVVRI